jgi:hypothetical protein
MQSHNLLSLAYITLGGAGPVEHLEAAAAAGFDAAGLRIVPLSHLNIDYGVIGNRERIREINRARERTGVRVFDIEVFTLREGTDIAQFVPALETSAELGASFVQVVSEDPDAGRAAATFAALCDAAAKCGLRVAIEFMRFRNLQTIEAANASWKRLAGRTPACSSMRCISAARAVARPPSQRFPVTASLTCSCAMRPRSRRPSRASRTKRATSGGCQGDGDLPLEELFDVLPDDVPISVEVPRSSDVDRSATERAVNAGDATRAWLARYRARHG